MADDVVYWRVVWVGGLEDTDQSKSPEFLKGANKIMILFHDYDAMV